MDAKAQELFDSAENRAFLIMLCLRKQQKRRARAGEINILKYSLRPAHLADFGLRRPASLDRQSLARPLRPYPLLLTAAKPCYGIGLRMAPRSGGA